MGKKINIVLADDHTIFRDALRQLLSIEPDFEVVGEAKNGTEVLDLVRELQPHILLLDLRMPGLDGLSALQRIQNQKLKTKIIVLTASDDEGEYVQAMRFGTFGIVLKHTATDLLIKSIRKVYGGEIWLDSKVTSALMRQFASPGELRPRERDKPRLSNREREIVALARLSQNRASLAHAAGLTLGPDTFRVLDEGKCRHPALQLEDLDRLALLGTQI